MAILKILRQFLVQGCLVCNCDINSEFLTRHQQKTIQIFFKFTSYMYEIVILILNLRMLLFWVGYELLFLSSSNIGLIMS
jgi:hypothetical protein